MATKKQSLKPLSEVIQEMSCKRHFCFVSLRRKFRPYFKTSVSPKGNQFGLSSKHGKGGVSFTIDITPYGQYAVIYMGGFPDSNYLHVRFDNNKELMQKLLKHNLI